MSANGQIQREHFSLDNDTKYIHLQPKLLCSLTATFHFLPLLGTLEKFGPSCGSLFYSVPEILLCLHFLPLHS